MRTRFFYLLRVGVSADNDDVMSDSHSYTSHLQGCQDFVVGFCFQHSIQADSNPGLQLRRRAFTLRCKKGCSAAAVK